MSTTFLERSAAADTLTSAARAAKRDADQARLAVVTPFLQALLTKLPIVAASTNDHGDDFDDEGHNYITLADHLTSGVPDEGSAEFHPMALDPRWAKITESWHAPDSDNSPCGSLICMLEGLVREVLPDHGIRRPWNGEDEGLEFPAWLARELEMEPAEVEAAMAILDHSDFEVDARRQPDGAVTVQVND